MMLLVAELLVFAALAGFAAAFWTRLLFVPDVGPVLDGPGGLLTWLRRALRAVKEDPHDGQLYVQDTFFGNMLSCPWCTMTWCAGVLNVLIFVACDTCVSDWALAVTLFPVCAGITAAIGMTVLLASWGER